MRTAPTALLTALALLLLAHGGGLACSSTSDGYQQPPAGSAGSAGVPAAGLSGGASTAGSAGTPAAGSAGSALGGSLGEGGSGASTGGAAGSAGSSAGAGGVLTAGSGGAGGSGGSAAGAGGSGGVAGSGGTVVFALTSPSFMNKAGCGPANLAACDKLALDFLDKGTFNGGNHSPEFDWTAGPSGTLSYAIALYDLSNLFTHWVIWNIPASTMKLPAALPAGSNPAGITGAEQVGYDGNKDAYAGPGAHSHVYQFTLYALRVATISPTVPAASPQKAVRAFLEASADVIAKSNLSAASP